MYLFFCWVFVDLSNFEAYIVHKIAGVKNGTILIKMKMIGFSENEEVRIFCNSKLILRWGTK